MYSSFCTAYALAMVASFYNLLPVFDFETMDSESVLSWMTFLSENMYVPFALAALYLVVIFSIQAYLEDKKPFDLKYALAAWSILLAVFSVVGSLRTVPALFGILKERGMWHLVCGDTRYDWLFDKPAGFWTILFILSKIPELIDTLFIVLRKKKLITLHVWHHITVMTFCWHSLATLGMNGLIFSAMNLTVHALMYTFYALTALGYRPTVYAKSITFLQILQMFVGTSVTVFVSVQEFLVEPQTYTSKIEATWDVRAPEELSDGQCKMHPVNAISGLGMYASYLWLFCAFFYTAYMAETCCENKSKIKKVNNKPKKKDFQKNVICSFQFNSI